MSFVQLAAFGIGLICLYPAFHFLRQIASPVKNEKATFRYIASLLIGGVFLGIALSALNYAFRY